MKKALLKIKTKTLKKENYEEIILEWNGILISIIAPKEQDSFAERILLKKAIIQRNQEYTTNISNVLEFDEICMDLLTHEVTIRHQIIKLTKTEYSILKIFLQHPEEVLQKSVFLESKEDCILDCVENSLKVHISNLRRKLKKITGRDYIESIRGVGFRLVHPKR